MRVRWVAGIICVMEADARCDGREDDVQQQSGVEIKLTRIHSLFQRVALAIGVTCTDMSKTLKDRLCDPAV